MLEPFRPLLDAGVTFQAALGNHDQVATIDYPPINMGGRRYYTYTRKNVRFFVLDSNVMERHAAALGRIGDAAVE